MDDVQNAAAAEDRGGLEAIANRIATDVAASEAPRDSALVVLAKGMNDAVQALIKGKKMDKVGIDDEAQEEGADKGKKDAKKLSKTANDPDEEEDEEGAEHEDETHEKASKSYDDDGGAGYEDMRMGKEGEYLDATELVVSLATDIKAMRKANVALTHEVKALRAKVEEIDAANRSAYGAVFSEMAKGVIGLHETLRATPMIPAGALSPAMQGKFRVIRENLDGVVQTSGLSMVQLTKALSQRIIDEDNLRFWKQTGKVSSDEAENTALVKQIKALQ